MNANDIYQIYGTDYKAMTLALLDAADLKGRIQSMNTRIGIKPNLVSPTPASFGATTHPEVVAGIIEYLQAHGFERLTMLEGSWVGDRTTESAEICGYTDLSEKYGVPFFDTQTDAAVQKDCAGMSLKICRIMEDIDFLINVPVMKGHCQTKVTCALKNLKGLIPDAEKRRFHSLGLHRPIAHLNAGIRQDFIVVDRICGDPDCEDGGNPVTVNALMAAVDPVLTDACACRLLGYACEEVPYLPLAASLGIGSMDLSSANIYTIKTAGADSARAGQRSQGNESAVIYPEKAWPDSESLTLCRTGANPEVSGGAGMRRFFDLHEHVEEVESCSACYANLIPALEQLKEEGVLELLQEKICIGQGFCGKEGALGCGNCTAGFDCSIPGCPPDTDDIIAFLREMLVP